MAKKRSKTYKHNKKKSRNRINYFIYGMYIYGAPIYAVKCGTIDLHTLPSILYIIVVLLWIICIIDSHIFPSSRYEFREKEGRNFIHENFNRIWGTFQVSRAIKSITFRCSNASRWRASWWQSPWTVCCRNPPPFLCRPSNEFCPHTQLLCFCLNMEYNQTFRNNFYPKFVIYHRLRLGFLMIFWVWRTFFSNLVYNYHVSATNAFCEGVKLGDYYDINKNSFSYSNYQFIEKKPYRDKEKVLRKWRNQLRICLVDQSKEDALKMFSFQN